MSSTPTVPKEYHTPEGLRTLANYLRGQNGIKVRSGIEHEKRVDYFKGNDSVFADNTVELFSDDFSLWIVVMTSGKRFIECILEGKKWPKSIPKITDSEIAVQVGELLLQSSFFHRSEKLEGKKGYLQVFYAQ